MLINLPRIDSDVPRTRPLLSLHQEEIGIVPCHNESESEESESEPDGIGMLERVPLGCGPSFVRLTPLACATAARTSLGFSRWR